MTAFHVKYRPVNFEDVVGQDPVVKSLKKVVRDNRAKAFIFTGPSGCGKTTIARIVANAFAGKDATIANIEEFDAATNSGADAVRSVAGRALYRAIGVSPVKAFIIDEAHRLSAAAWTVLLKPIEEPPAHVYWMFCTTEASKIPKTIETRCLRYDLKPVTEDEIFKLLCTVVNSEQLDIDDSVLDIIVESSAGSPRQALVYLEECLYAETAEEARQITRAAGRSKEVIDLCRFITNSSGKNWQAATKIIRALEGTDAESARIVIVNYIASALLKTTNERKAAELLRLLECFKTPYNQSDKMAPLLYSIGLALDLDGTV